MTLPDVATMILTAAAKAAQTDAMPGGGLSTFYSTLDTEALVETNLPSQTTCFVMRHFSWASVPIHLDFLESIQLPTS